MRRTDVEFHSDGFRPSRPAVNVKVRGSYDDVTLPLELGGVSEDGGKTWQAVLTDPLFTHEWIEDNMSEESVFGFFDAACQDAWEMLTEDAKEIFGSHVKVYSEGRSGGWAVVDGLPEFDTWDAIMLGKWGKFTRYARAYADDVPRAMVDLIYANVFEPWKDHEDDINSRCVL